MTYQIQRFDEKLHDTLFQSEYEHEVPYILHSTDVNSNVSVVCVSSQYEPEKPARFGKFCQYGILQTESTQYQLLSSLGQGTFGEVILSYSKPSNEYVAIKLLEDSYTADEKAWREINFLQKIKEADGERYNLLYYHCAFTCLGQHCIVLEALEQTLDTYMIGRQYQPLRLSEIRPILKQIYVALDKLQELKIIHTDLKPQNIMFVNTLNCPYKIKLVDFGNAISLDETHRYNTLQTLYYRSPEIILGAPYEHTIDMWSVGCIAAELYLGCVLYQGYTAYDQIRLICETQGLPEEESLRTGAFTRNYFYKYRTSFWVLKPREVYTWETSLVCGDGCQYRFHSLGDLFYVRSFMDPNLYSSVLEDRHAFISLVKEMLSLNRRTRISPKVALEHKFITMTGLKKRYNCAHARESLEIMRQH